MPGRIIRRFRGLPVGYRLGLTFLGLAVLVAVSIIGVTHEMAKQFIIGSLETRLESELSYIKGPYPKQ